MKSFLALVVLVCACGCSPNKNLARSLKEADRVVVTNSFDGLSITVTGKEVNRMVKAIASGEKLPPSIAASVDFNLQFFKGTEHLATLPTSVMIFWAGDKAYSDRTGTLEALKAKYREEHPPSSFSR